MTTGLFAPAQCKTGAPDRWKNTGRALAAAALLLPLALLGSGCGIHLQSDSIHIEHYAMEELLDPTVAFEAVPVVPCQGRQIAAQAWQCPLLLPVEHDPWLNLLQDVLALFGSLFGLSGDNRAAAPAQRP